MSSLLGPIGILLTLISVPATLDIWPTILALVTGVPFIALTVCLLWPVYLSLIGNIERADEYVSNNDETSVSLVRRE
jgi:hypothetical protein